LEGFLSELLNTKVTIESLLESESNKNHHEDLPFRTVAHSFPN